MESIALFGKAATISAILAVAAEHGQSNWDCVGADPVWLDGGDSRHAVERFDGESVPPLILDRLGQTISHCPGAADTPHGGEFE